MCGINGFNWKDEELIKKMNERIRHRGPDDEGYYVDDNVSLGNVRLSIIDLSKAGHQPMCNETEDIWIVYNGEIYNYMELRKELEEKGHIFKSNTDTEVIIHSYEEWGTECVEKFNGMWAFAIYDKRKNILFLSRDRFGIKPLYYYIDDDKFIFSSEIKAILLHNIARAPNDEIIFDFLCFDLIDHTEYTFFKNIMRIMPGNNAIFDIENKKLKIWRYYNLKEKIDKMTKEKKKFYIDKEKEKFKHMLFTAVKRRLIADVPVGSCLSGGLDSSSIVCIMRKIDKDGQIKAFSLVFPGHKIDESKYQKVIVEKCNTMWHSTTFTANDLLNDLEDLIWTQEEPFGTLSIYGQYRVMKLAKENGMKVLLDGQGSDEILAGYHHFFGDYYYELLKDGKWKTLLEEVISYYKLHGNLKPLLYMFLKILPKNIIKKLWSKRIKYLKKEFISLISKRRTKDIMWDVSTLNKSLYLAEIYYSLPRLLRFEDKNAMRWSIESRVPFCDHEVVEYVLCLPSNFKIKKGKTKIILREAMRDILPKEIINRHDKIAFATPDKYLLRTPQGIELAKKIIYSESFKKRRYWNHDVIKKMFQQHIYGKKNYEKILWKVIILELWLRRYIDECKK